MTQPGGDIARSEPAMQPARPWGCKDTYEVLKRRLRIERAVLAGALVAVMSAVAVIAVNAGASWWIGALPLLSLIIAVVTSPLFPDPEPAELDREYEAARRRLGAQKDPAAALRAWRRRHNLEG